MPRLTRYAVTILYKGAEEVVEVEASSKEAARRKARALRFPSHIIHVQKIGSGTSYTEGPHGLGGLL